MEQIKSLADVVIADPRSSLWEMVNRQTGKRRSITLEDHHGRFSRVRVNEDVPEEVQNGIAIASNLYIYSWFVYSFGPVAELQCLATLELALRHRSAKSDLSKWPRFRDLFSDAVEQGLLVDAGLPPEPVSLQPIDEREDHREGHASAAEGFQDPQQRVRHLANSLPDWRNTMAHGAFMLFPPGNYLLVLVLELINQLWPKRASSS